MHAYIACGVLRNISPEMVFSRLHAGGDTMVPQWLAVLILLFLSPSPLSGISEFCIILPTLFSKLITKSYTSTVLVL